MVHVCSVLLGERCVVVVMRMRPGTTFDDTNAYPKKSYGI